MLVEDASSWIATEMEKIDVLPNDINNIIVEYANDTAAKNNVAVFLESTFPEDVFDIIKSYNLPVIKFTLSPSNYAPSGTVNMGWGIEYKFPWDESDIK